MLRGRRGLAIITGLFIVLTIFTLVTLTISDARRSLEVTRYAADRTQAYFEARSGVERSLKSLNEQPAWEAEHTGTMQAAEYKSPAGAVTRVWVEPVDAEHIRIRAVCKQNHTTAEACEFLNRRRPVDGTTIALWKPEGPDSLFIKRESEGGWTNLPPPPKTFWVQDQNGAWTQQETVTYSNGKPKPVEDLKHLTGDAHGNLYAVWSRDSNPDMIYRYDGATKSWALLPALPKMVLQDGAFVPTGNLVGSIEGLASNGEKLLYALNRMDDTVDAIHVLDLEQQQNGWTTLPPVPARVFRPGQNGWEQLAHYSKGFRSLSVDGRGNAYALTNLVGYPDTLHYFAPTSSDAPGQGQWRVLPPIPDGHFELEPGRAPRFVEDNTYVGKARQLSVGPDGRVVVRQGQQQMDMIYAFSPDASVAPGQVPVQGGAWNAVDPAPRIFYNSQGERQVQPGEYALQHQRNAMTKSGKLVASWQEGDRQSLLRYDFGTKSWDDLPPIPRKRNVVNDAKDVVELTLPGFNPDLAGLDGGGVADTSRWEYTRAGSY